MGCQAILGISQDTTVIVPPDAAADGGVGGAIQYHDLSTLMYWSTFDTTTLSPSAQGFLGGTFDGRYVYFAPSANTFVNRYDTHAEFSQPSSWQTFNAASFGLGGASTAGGGAAFDGLSIYFVSNSIVASYTSDGEPSVSFANASNWSNVDISQLAKEETGLLNTKGSPWTTTSAAAFVGATFDGRYLYLAPSQGTVVVRFDTTQVASAAQSWEAYDAATLTGSFSSSTGAYQGSVFDGRYVYFIPAGSLPVLRYDLELDFASEAAWQVFDTGTVESGANDFRCGAYDGRYLYLVPSGTSLVARYDTTGSFSSRSSWSIFDTRTVNPGAVGFGGSAFDGRYVYLIPSDTAIIARYDTTSVFTEQMAWQAFDTSLVSNSLQAFGGAVFDGRYVYLVPSVGGRVARFDARTPASLPSIPQGAGSFL